MASYWNTGIAYLLTDRAASPPRGGGDYSSVTVALITSSIVVIPS